MRITADKPGKIALLWRGDRQARDERRRRTTGTIGSSRRWPRSASRPSPRSMPTRWRTKCAAQLLGCDGVLVWVDPIAGRTTRVELDALLRDVASRGVWVSAHPDVILKMGVKEVLHRTRHLGWGTDTHLYRTADDISRGVSAAAARGGSPRAQAEPRQWRPGRLEGRIDLSRPRPVRVLHARRGSVPEDDRRSADFMTRCEAYFTPERMHRRSAVPAAAARRHDPLLHGRRQGRRVWPPVHQGADPAAARRAGVRRRAARPAHHASGLGAAVSRR